MILFHIVTLLRLRLALGLMEHDLMSEKQRRVEQNMIFNHEGVMRVVKKCILMAKGGD